MQKQTSMNPNAGSGKWSRDFVLKAVFLREWMLVTGAGIVCKGCKAGKLATALDELPRFALIEGFDFIAARTGIAAFFVVFFFIGFSFFTGYSETLLYYLRDDLFGLLAIIAFPYFIVSAIDLVLVARFFLVCSKYFSPYATTFCIVEVLLSGFEFFFELVFLAILLNLVFYIIH